MSSGTFNPLPALLAEVDGADWEGATIWTLGARPAWTHPAGVRYYDDALAMLCGRCSQPARSIGEELAAVLLVAGSASTWTLGFLSDISPTVRTSLALPASYDLDRLYIRSTLTTFTVTGVTLGVPHGAALGYGTSASQASVGASDGFNYVVAPESWTRGQVPAFTYINVDEAGAVPSVQVPAAATRVVQSVPTWVRATTTVDADDDYATTCLEASLNADQDAGAGGARMRLSLDSAGRTVATWPTALTASTTPGWVNTALRDYLGYTGCETGVSSGGMVTYTSTNRCAGVLAFGLTWRQLDETQTWESSGVRLRSGAVVATGRLSRRGYEYTVIIPGPARPTSDLRHHLLDRFLPQMMPGCAGAFYHQWGDPRRVLRTLDVRSGATAETQAPYTSWQTSELDGERGRLLVRRALDDGQSKTLSYPGGPRVETQITMRFDALVTG
jgi:hypothetical protein